jgi:hypothetical protein
MECHASRIVLAARSVAVPALLLAGVSLAAAQGAPVARLACGAYEAVPSGIGPAGQPTRLGLQKDGRLLLTVGDWSITRVECAELGGDKTPDLLVATSSGGAHCCETVRVWALGASPKPLLEYDSGNAAGFEVRDLDGDGRRELVIGDDSFAYFDDLCYACSPSHLPLVACATDAGFEDCTRRFPALLRTWMARYEGRLTAADADIKQREGAALGVLAIAVLLGEEDSGLAAVRKAVADKDVIAWLDRARPRVRDWAEARGRKLKARDLGK